MNKVQELLYNLSVRYTASKTQYDQRIIDWENNRVALVNLLRDFIAATSLPIEFMDSEITVVGVKFPNSPIAYKILNPNGELINISKKGVSLIYSLNYNAFIEANLVFPEITKTPNESGDFLVLKTELLGTYNGYNQTNNKKHIHFEAFMEKAINIENDIFSTGSNASIEVI